MSDHHVAELRNLLQRAEADFDPSEFRRYGSARTLYNFNVDNASAY
jgi:methylamine---glutamate N-methyltransferase subunit B